MLPPRPRDPWIDDEPRLGGLLQQVGSRALRRPLQLFGVALLLTGLIVVQRVRRAPIYVATATFRMVEGDIANPESEYTPPPPRAIRQYIDAVALSQKQLLEIMKRHNISTKLRNREPVAAVEAMREDIEVNVSRNYFIFDRRRDDAPRSAAVSISFPSSSNELARAVVHELGQAVLDAQGRQRSDRMNAARTLLEAERSRAAATLHDAQKEVDRLLLEGVRARGSAFITNQALLANAQLQLKSMLTRVQGLERRDAALDLAADVEDQRLGVAFQLVDEDVLVVDPQLGFGRLARLAVSLLLCVGMVTIVVVGGWGRHVDTPDDLAAAGIPILGRIVRFPGDDVGSYRSRTRKRAGKPGILKG